MRFLFGIFLGAGLTLLLATAVDAPTSPVLEQLRGGWQRVLDVTGEALFRQQAAPAPAEPQVGSGDGAANVVPEADPAVSVTETDAADLAHVREALSARAAEELAQLARALDPERIPAPVLERADEGDAENAEDMPPARVPEQAPARDAGTVSNIEPPPAASTTPGRGQDETIVSAVPDPAVVRAERFEPPASLSLPPEESPATVASVWVPFHSERSARGFARRLTVQLDHPFEVQREGAGAYSVVFSYADPAQRDALLSEVEELTGR